MGSVLGSIFGFGDKLKRRLKDAVSNPSDYAEMTADENRNEWRKNPDERSMGFFNPVPMGTMGNFVLRKGLQDAVEGGTDLSRREFMKKSAGLAAGSTVGAGVTAKLLRKFAPEERAVVKEVVAEAAPKYKYNSLKEYLDDVSAHAEDRATGYSNRYGGSWSDYHPDYMKTRLLQDELAYKTAKDNLARPNPKKDFNTGLPPQSQRDLIDAFSPQAKKEMKAWKDMRPHGWTNPNEFELKMINRGLIPNHNGSLALNPNTNTWSRYNPGKPMEFTDGFKSMDEARLSLQEALEAEWKL